MSVWAVLLIAVGVAADAFAVSLGKGMAMRPFRQRDAVALAVTFGVFQAVMPLIGWLLGSTFAPFIASVDHWVAFALLAAIGAHMVVEAWHDEVPDETRDARISLRNLLVLGVATSIDALVVGVGLALLEAGLLQIVAAIGLVTATLSYLGVLLGRRAGDRFGRPAAVLGGLILIGLGVQTVLEHTGILA